MLKKKIAATITASTRICKNCGRIVVISTTDDKTICKCGEVVYDIKKDNNINGEIAHETSELKANDSSTKSNNSK